MLCIKSEKVALDDKMRICVIIADDMPATLPTTGEGVDHLDDDITIAPGSMLMAIRPGKVYIMGEHNEFVEMG